jgi:hypothetical protein
MTREYVVHVTVGVGAWTTSRTVRLVAAPHVGDFIVVGKNEISVTCERVTIRQDSILVEETIRFASEQDAKDYFG